MCILVFIVCLLNANFNCSDYIQCNMKLQKPKWKYVQQLGEYVFTSNDLHCLL